MKYINSKTSIEEFIRVNGLEWLQSLCIYQILLMLCFLNNIKLIKAQTFFEQIMHSTNTNTFFGFPNPQNSPPDQNLPFYLFYMNCNPMPNFDYETYYAQGFVNNDIMSNNFQIRADGPLITSQKSQNTKNKLPAKNEKNASQNNQQTSSFRNSSKLVKQHQKLKLRKVHSSDEEYSPQDSSSFDAKGYKLSQTKNIPKNYEKAIIQFISKNLSYTNKVLQHCGVDFSDFMNCYHGMTQNLGSMAKLRSLWMDSENPYAKVFRIISKEYLRKHSLGYIFNSRVINISKHIKYRHIIQESIGKPQCFTHMKQY